MTTAERIYAAFEKELSPDVPHELKPPDTPVLPPEPDNIPRVYWWKVELLGKSLYPVWVVADNDKDLADTCVKLEAALKHAGLRFTFVQDHTCPPHTRVYASEVSRFN